MIDREEKETFRSAQDIINQLSVILRNAQIHNPWNIAVTTAIEKFIALISHLTTGGKTITLELIGEDAREMIVGISSVFAFERPIAVPPGVPPERLNVLREALWKSLHDPGMIEWSKKVRPILPLNGEETEKLLKQALPAGNKLKPLLEDSLK